MRTDLQALCSVVQRNCNISDAIHAADYTLCVYLLKMREFYRWEKGYPYTEKLPTAEIGNWLTEREELWRGLENQPFSPIELDGFQLDPFDTDAINDKLLPKGFVYSAGLGRKLMPHFFLAKLEKQQALNSYSILIASEEYARDLTAPPAMTLGQNIFLRRESIRRMIWEKVQESRWNGNQTPMTRAMSYYDFEADAESALNGMTNNELDTILRHELGEVLAGEKLGGAWQEMLASLSRTKAEIMARAVRDNLADVLCTLPGLLRDFRPASLHFLMTTLTAMRKELFPSLLGAYEQWLANEELIPLEALVTRATNHWLAVCQEMLDLHAAHGKDGIPGIEALIQKSKL